MPFLRLLPLLHYYLAVARTVWQNSIYTLKSSRPYALL